ncbi:CDP-alcohol phosphatidyltransferase family protein [Frankia nepalensis]|uniref:CDP-alcohol phosphatidyltransferase family protein n=1 Tax=Frankia nepalensis TaxID=1836974 RepID=UPI0027DDAD00|nr:CDP-alcohol phosphatidyltransferase family protein [Frankia nepalensis]
MGRVQTPIPGRDDYFSAWAVTHGGYDPATGSALVRHWLGLTYRLARPLAAHSVPPAAVTAAAAALPALALPLAAAGGRWPLLVALVVAASGLLDNLDGAVAILRARASAAGFVLDSVADRVADGLYLIALWLLGAPGWLVVAAGAAVGLLEYTRARAGNAGLGEIGVVTVGERPTRVIIAVAGPLAAGCLPGLREPVAAAAAAGTLAVAVVGLGQLTAVLRRVLGGRPERAGRRGPEDVAGGSGKNGGGPPARRS